MNTTKRIATPSVTRGLMQDFGVAAKKSLGQNFIIEPQIINRIVETAACDKQDLVLEIGPGLGSLTQALAEAAGEVVAVEIDQTLLPPLAAQFAAYPNVALIHADALQADIAELLAPYAGQPGLRPGFMVVANLPYYITTPLILRILTDNAPWRRLVFMVQKELAARLQAAPGGKDYGALSLAVQYRAQAKLAFTVPAAVFLPRPKVDSAVVVLDRLPAPPVQVQDEAALFAVIRAGFNQRRKTLANALGNVLGLEKALVAAALDQAGIDGGRRAETLTLAEFAALSNAMTQMTKTVGNSQNPLD